MTLSNVFKKETRYKAFFLSLLLSAIGFGLYKGVIDNYLAEAENILTKRGNEATLSADKRMTAFIRQVGKEQMLETKRNNYNLQLENFVVGADQHRLLDVVDGQIVPRAGFVYLTPRSTNGRAPFYSSEKILGTWHIKTLWYNLGVMLLMCMIVAGLLLSKVLAFGREK